MLKIISTLAALMAGLMLFTGTAVSRSEDNFGVTRIQSKSPGHKTKAKKARVKSGQG
ncbi:MAG: hypothetical protein M0P73_06295 [Syntrophobacterales bacterium]|jgi:hypothetical protein|nr:hypothetical protein [Syntrophobacterales bacterium]